MSFGVYDATAEDFVRSLFGQIQSYPNLTEAGVAAVDCRKVWPDRSFAVYQILPSGKPYLGAAPVTLSVDDILHLAPHDHNLLPH